MTSRRSPKGRGVSSELYTTEGGESRKRAVADQVIPDPEVEEGKDAIDKHTLPEDEDE